MKRDENLRIRILILGPPGVGKDSLESRFTTMTWPPPYNPALTLTSRRHFTLLEKREAPYIPASPRVDTSLRLDFDMVNPDTAGLFQPQRSSSIYSQDDSNQDASIFERRHEPETPTTPITPRSLSDGCYECVKTANTFMVEILNYPLLQHTRERVSVLAGGEYDAVLLLYDVGSRESFERIPGLHNEIPLRWSRHAGPKRSSWRSQSLYRSDTTVIALAGTKVDLDGDFLNIVPVVRRPRLPREKGSDTVDREDAEGEMEHMYREANIFDGNIPPPSSSSLTAHTVTSESPNSATSSDVSVPHAPAKLVKRPSVRSVRAKGGRAHPIVRGVSSREVVHTRFDISSPSRNKPAVDETHEITQVSTQTLASTSASERQVSRAEGDALTRLLHIRVPFFETSARTGDNVEELFDAVVREVLKRKGMDVPEVKAGGGKMCRLHAARDSKFSSPVSSPVDSIRGTGLPQSLEGSPGPADRGDEWPPASAGEEADAGPAPILIPVLKPVRRQSVLKRMSSMILRKKQPAMTGVSA